MPLCSSPLEKQRTGRVVCSSWGFWFVIIKWWITFTEAELIYRLPRKQMSLWREKGSLPVIQGCVVSGYWSGPKHLAALPPLPDMCAQYALLLCGSPCGEGLAFYFEAAQWQVSREIGTFCLGWWNIIFFWEGRSLFKGVFLRVVGPLSCSEWEGGGCHPRLLAVPPCVFFPVALQRTATDQTIRVLTSLLLAGFLLCWFPLPQLYVF